MGGMEFGMSLIARELQDLRCQMKELQLQVWDMGAYNDAKLDALTMRQEGQLHEVLRAVQTLQILPRPSSSSIHSAQHSPSITIKPPVEDIEHCTPGPLLQPPAQLELPLSGAQETSQESQSTKSLGGDPDSTSESESFHSVSEPLAPTHRSTTTSVRDESHLPSPGHSSTAVAAHSPNEHASAPRHEQKRESRANPTASSLPKLRGLFNKSSKPAGPPRDHPSG
jgi:hypothetical protein